MIFTDNIFSDKHTVGTEMHQLMSELYPLCRSITGDGIRETLKIIGAHISLAVNEVPTGTKVFDWTIPKEWNVKGGYIKNSKGEKVVDFKDSNLHVLNYSVPVHKKLPLKELKKHLFTMPEHPDWIPFRTSYYQEAWGFCMTHNQFLTLINEEEMYEVLIDSSLKDGHLSYGEYFIRGEKQDEVLISCHVCHPSLCNDNLSGVVIAVFLAKYLTKIATRYSYRFLFIPATIGSIAWLALNESTVTKIKHGLVAACLGDSGKFTYKKSRMANAEIDRTVKNVLKNSGSDYEIIEFFPYGYDERQYCSPGFNLPIGCLMRTPHGRYAEYHSSADNLAFVQPQNLADSFFLYQTVFGVLENNKKYLNTNPKCEPQLGKRGLYQKIGGQSESKTQQLAMLWILNLSDGNNCLLDISDRSNLAFDLIKDTTEILLENGLLSECAE